VPILGVFRPDLIERRDVVGRVGPVVPSTLRDEGDHLVLHVDHVSDPGGPVLAPHCVQNPPGLGIVVDPRVIAPAVGGEQQIGDEVEFPVRRGAFRIVLAGLRVDAPCKIGLPRPLLMLHVFGRPAPQAVEHVLLVQLHGHHHAVRQTFRAGVVVLEVGDVSHRVAHLEVDSVRAFEQIVVRLGQLGVDVLLFVSGLQEHVAVLARFPRTRFPRLHLAPRIVHIRVGRPLADIRRPQQAELIRQQLVSPAAGRIATLVEELEVVGIEDHPLVVSVADQFAVADVPRPGRCAVFERDVVDPGERRLPRVGVRHGRPHAVEAVGDPGAVVPGRAHRLDHGQIGVGALDLVGDARLEEAVSAVFDGDLRVAHALGEVLDPGPAAIEVAVVAREEEIGMRVVADDVVIDRKPGHARGSSFEEVLRLGPGLGLGNVLCGAILRRLRLEDKVPLLVGREVEQVWRAVVAVRREMRVHIDERQLGVGGVGPVLEVQIHHGPGPGGRRVGGRVDVPQVVVANDCRVLDGHDGVVRIGDGLDQYAGGFPPQRRGEGQLGSVGIGRHRRAGLGGRLARRCEENDAGQQRRDNGPQENGLSHKWNLLTSLGIRRC